MSNSWSIAEDVVPWLAYTLAIVAVLAVPVRERGPFSRDAKAFFVASLFCYMAVTTGSVLKEMGALPAWLPPVLAVVEVLWIPFLLFGVYAMYARQQLNDALSASAAFARTGLMADEIAETAPAGIVVLGDTGLISFANRKARELLDLPEDDCATQRSSGWTVRLERAGAPGEVISVSTGPDLSPLLCPEPLHEVTMVVEWPTGWTRRMAVNTSPFLRADGAVAGAIAAFVEREAGPDTV